MASTGRRSPKQDIDDVIERTNSGLDRKGYLAYIGANSTLINVPATLEGVPFVKVNLVFLRLASPLRMSPDAADTLVSFYGHFPDIDQSHPTTVEMKMKGVGKLTSNLEKYAGNQLGFKVPTSHLKEGQFVEMMVRIPAAKYYCGTQRRMSALDCTPKSEMFVQHQCPIGRTLLFGRAL
jgi:hypothetical protein